MSRDIVEVLTELATEERTLDIRFKSGGFEHITVTPYAIFSHDTWPGTEPDCVLMWDADGADCDHWYVHRMREIYDAATGVLLWSHVEVPTHETTIQQLLGVTP